MENPWLSKASERRDGQFTFKLVWHEATLHEGKMYNPHQQTNKRKKPIVCSMGEWKCHKCAHVADQLAASTKIARDC